MLCTVVAHLLAAANRITWLGSGAALQKSLPIIVDYNKQVCDCQQYVQPIRGEA